MAYSIQHIATIIQATPITAEDAIIEYLITDSRKIVFPRTSLFFAISGIRRDGHSFIGEVYERGIRHFVVMKGFVAPDYSDAIFLQVADVRKALQHLAAYHRSTFTIPIIGITGSNGKTIVKEWLFQLLQPDFNIVRSPRSYNSQIGVPLSVWQIQPHHTLGIFEAGISTIDEMESLAQMIKPSIGVFTNLSDAHSEGFNNQRQKALEKAQLFAEANVFVFGRDSLQPFLLPDSADHNQFNSTVQYFSWSRELDATIRILTETKHAQHTLVTALYQGSEFSVTIPFTDKMSIDNAITCCCVLFQMNYSVSIIQERILLLEPVDMRMQLKKAIQNCYLLNDSYSNDLSSLDLALDYLQQQAGKQTTSLILSDMLQSGIAEDILYKQIAEKIAGRGIDQFIAIGLSITKYEKAFYQAQRPEGKKPLIAFFYSTTTEFLQQASTLNFKDEYILLKGARIFEFERISNWLEQKVHQTVMEINLTALIQNLNIYQKLLRPETKLMAMVKAFSYGSGSAEVARILQFHKVDYLAVAYADEGVELRKAGIRLPIMVMNPDEASFASLVTYQLEPEIYSFPIYHSFHLYLSQQGLQTFPVHIKFNTGMNRLGFETEEAMMLGQMLQNQPTMAVKSVFSHLVASESREQDRFTEQQITLFTNACAVLQEQLGYSFIRHIANSAAIIRHPASQFEMVRLGIGLYGVSGRDEEGLTLETVIVLKSTIAQIRKVKAGDTIGYGRKGVVSRDSLIATVRVGYADGYNRRLGNGKGYIHLHGKLAPVIGQVCMDMVMIDVTDIPEVKEEDEVELFGKNLSVQQVAQWSDTIAYEIMTGISQRVKRVYMQES